MKANKKAPQTVIPSRSLTPQRRPLFPRHVDEVPTSRDRSLHDTLGEPIFSHDFGQIRVYPEAETTRPAIESCPLALTSPRFCPFGGACDSCPPRIQTKLIIGQPNDRYEQEADRVADLVMRMPEPRLQRQFEPGEEEEEEEEEEILQTKSHTGQTPEVTSDLDSRINSLKGSGQPLPESTRAFFEPRFGQDFSQVRVHTDAKAAESARAVNARAYTAGRNVVFRAGQYAPGSGEGRRLLAHELAHVIQQRERSQAVATRLDMHQANDTFERDVDAVADAVMFGQKVSMVLSRAADVQVQRQEKSPTGTCEEVVFYTRLDLQWPVSDRYFTDGKEIKESGYEKGIKAERKKGKCEITIKEEIEIPGPNPDVTVHFFYKPNPCCKCFSGTLSWDVTVDGTPQKGSRSVSTGGKCAGERCCSVNKGFRITLEVAGYKISGTITVDGSTFK